LARARGTAQITAARSQCGKAQQCITPMDSALLDATQFEVTIVVE
jgi:hypothetical protein